MQKFIYSLVYRRWLVFNAVLKNRLQQGFLTNDQSPREKTKCEYSIKQTRNALHANLKNNITCFAPPPLLYMLIILFHKCIMNTLDL